MKLKLFFSKGTLCENERRCLPREGRHHLPNRKQSIPIYSFIHYVWIALYTSGTGLHGDERGVYYFLRLNVKAESWVSTLSLEETMKPSGAMSTHANWSVSSTETRTHLLCLSSLCSAPLLTLLLVFDFSCTSFGKRCINFSLKCGKHVA